MCATPQRAGDGPVELAEVSSLTMRKGVSWA